MRPLTIVVHHQSDSMTETGGSNRAANSRATVVLPAPGGPVSTMSGAQDTSGRYRSPTNLGDVIPALRVPTPARRSRENGAASAPAEAEEGDRPGPEIPGTNRRPRR